MSVEVLREYFAKCKGVIKFYPFLKQLDIQSGNFSRFLKTGQVDLINYDKLFGLYILVNCKIKELIN